MKLQNQLVGSLKCHKLVFLIKFIIKFNFTLYEILCAWAHLRHVILQNGMLIRCNITASSLSLSLPSTFYIHTLRQAAAAKNVKCTYNVME